MPDKLDRIEEVFGAALEIEPERRGAFVAGELAADPEALREVLSLLDARERTPDFLGTPAPVPARGRSTLVFDRLGPWRIVREIGAGGMGSVWLAERDDGQFKAKAAIKLIHAQLLSGAQRADVLRRFVEERQTLADLDHPYIAHLLDGGEAPDGSPFLVLEYVDGLPLDRYCAEEKLDRNERLRLFVRICQAVQYAHGRLVAHRDLKPQNVLVRRASDGTAEPKLLDFGIARLLSAASNEERDRTTIGSARLTPAYASPEQFRGEPATAQSDVYALGVILFELLTGKLPYDLTGALPIVAQRVCNDPPRRASELEPKLRGDLETILFKSLAKEPSARYATVGDLKDDIERHLSNHPIRARPVSGWERFAKTVRRNPLPFSLAAGLFVSVSALSVWLGVLYTRSVTAEKSAQARREHAERTSEILRQLLVAPNPFAAHGKDVTVVDVLDDSAPRVLAGLADQPEIRAELGRLVSETYTSLGAFDRAQGYMRQALADAERVFGKDSAEALLVAGELAELEIRLGQIDEAEKRQRERVETTRRLHGENDPATLDALDSLAGILRETKQPAEAEGHARAAYEGLRDTVGPSDRRTLHALSTMASVLMDLGRWSECADLVQTGLDIEAELSERFPQLRLSLLVHLGLALVWQEDLVGGARVLKEALDDRRRILGQEHPDTLESEVFYAEVVLKLGDIDGAEKLVQHAIAGYERTGEQNRTSFVHANLLQSDVLLQRDRMDEADAAAHAGYEMAVERLGATHWLTINALTKLWIVALEAGNLPVAEVWLQKQLATLREVYGPLHRDVLTGEGNLALILQRERRLTQAEAILRALPKKLVEAGLGSSPEHATYLHNLGLVLQDQGRLDEAEEVLRTTFDDARRSLGEDNMGTAHIRASQARVLAKQGEAACAEEAFDDALRRFRSALPSGHPRILRHLSEMAQFYERAGRSETARSLRAEMKREVAGS